MQFKMPIDLIMKVFRSQKKIGGVFFYKDMYQNYFTDTKNYKTI